MELPDLAGPVVGQLELAEPELLRAWLNDLAVDELLAVMAYLVESEPGAVHEALSWVRDAGGRGPLAH